MNDIYIFGLGLFVSLIVASAVGLLLWGAANEPSGNAVPAKDTLDPQPQPDQRAPAAAKVVENRSIA